jgi:hypothetical protein
MRYRNPEIYAAIIAKGEDYASVALAMGWPLNTFNKKMQGRRSWQEGELEKLKAYLGLKGGPIPDRNVKKLNVKGDQKDDQD